MQSPKTVKISRNFHPVVGNLAVWVAAEGGVGEKVEWDTVNLKVTNLDQLKTPGVAELIKPKYRGDHRLD